jgi:hypothetical protein
LAKNVRYLAQSGNRPSLGLVVANETHSVVRAKIGCAGQRPTLPARMDRVPSM